MRLRILDDLRPGYAQLAFDQPYEAASLLLSVRTQHEGLYLGPGGAWQKLPQYFTVTRIEGDAHSSLYQAGPEIVNHLRELDTVEFASEDGSLSVETTWENAIPQIIKGAGPGHSYGRQAIAMEPVAERPIAFGQRPEQQQPPQQPEPPIEKPEPLTVQEAPPAAKEEPVPDIVEDKGVEEEPAAEEIPPEIVTETPLSETPPVAEEVDDKTVIYPQRDDVHDKPVNDEPVHDEPPLISPGPIVPPKPLSIGLLIILGLLAFAASAAVAAYAFLPCSFFGTCKVDQAEVEAVQKARMCIFYKAEGGLDCDVAKECVEPYRTSFPNGASRAELDAKAKTSDETCKQMTAASNTALACIADLKKINRSRCDVQVACTQTFQSLYSARPLRRKIDQESDQAKADCDCERNPRACRSRTEDVARTDEPGLWLAAQDCAKDAERKCALPGCFSAYLTAFPSGPHSAEAQKLGDGLANSCASPDEKSQLQAARSCATGAKKCEQGCYAPFLTKYAGSSLFGPVAQKEAAALDTSCTSQNAQRDETSAWAAAQRCAAVSSACNTAACYDDLYLSRYSGGAHASDANSLAAKARDACSRNGQNASIDGRYWGRSLSGCGARADFAIDIEVKTGKISWAHNFLGTNYQWAGTIDASGNVTAAADGINATATGHLGDSGERLIRMSYPQCTAGPISLEVRGKY